MSDSDKSFPSGNDDKPLQAAGGKMADKPGSDTVVAADHLPPVQPPAAGFIVQLFLVPLVIVSIIVGVWLVFGWMARSGSDPARLVEDLERMNHSSWQQALTLANLLQDPRNSGIRRNTILAKRLGDILELHLNEGHTDTEHVQLRSYLCMAIGEFETSETLPVLVKAATKEDDPAELDVRRAAVWAMGRLVEHVGPAALAENEPAVRALQSAVADGAAQAPGPEPTDEFLARGRLRSTAVFVLGKVGTDEARDIMAGRLYGDPYPDTRYNAAAQLARLGDARALPLLVEMMDPTNEKPLQYEKSESAKTWKRQEVIVQGMEATIAWLEATDSFRPGWESSDGVSFADLQQAVNGVIQANFSGAVETRALDLKRRLESRL